MIYNIKYKKWCCRNQERNCGPDDKYFQSSVAAPGLHTHFLSSLTLPSYLNYCLLLLFHSFTVQRERVYAASLFLIHWHVMTEDWQPLSVSRPPFWRQSNPQYLSVADRLTTAYTHKSMCTRVCVCILSAPIVVFIHLWLALWICPEALLLRNQQICKQG